MPLSNEQIEKLLAIVANTREDPLDCDGCHAEIAAFAEAELAGQPLDEALRTVQSHLQNCSCCAEEFQSLWEALRTLQEE